MDSKRGYGGVDPVLYEIRVESWRTQKDFFGDVISDSLPNKLRRPGFAEESRFYYASPGESEQNRVLEEVLSNRGEGFMGEAYIQRVDIDKKELDLGNGTYKGVPITKMRDRVA